MSSERDGIVTMQPPMFRVMRLENWPVPCISGHAESVTKGGTLSPIRLMRCSNDSAGEIPTSA